MALVKCPKCGREKISDQASQCPDCGYAIKQHFENEITKAKKIEEERIKAEQKKREEEFARDRKLRKEKLSVWFARLKKIILGCVVVAVVISAMMYLFKSIILPMKQYKAAVELLNENRYDEAVTGFLSLGDYKDSKTKINEIYFEQARQELENDNLDTAKGYLKKISNESMYIEKIDMLFLESGKKYVEKGEIEKAKLYFMEMTDSEGKSSELDKMYYEIAIQAFDDDKVEVADKCLKQIQKFEKYNDSIRESYIVAFKNCNNLENMKIMLRLAEILSTRSDVIDDSVNQEIMSILEHKVDEYLKKDDLATGKEILISKILYGNSAKIRFEEDIETAYKMAKDFYDNKKYSEAKILFEAIRTEKYEDTELYLDAIYVIELLQNDKILMSSIEILSKKKTKYVPSELMNRLTEAKDYCDQIEGAYYNHYYYYIDDYKVYWGDGSGCYGVPVQYDYDKKYLVGDGFGLCGDKLKKNGSGIEDQYRVYQRVSVSKLPQSFDKYI